jgi:hypothetical protein
MVTRFSYPPEFWLLNEEARSYSEFDHIDFKATEVPLLIGEAGGDLYSRIVEHAPRPSQAVPDQARSILYANSGGEWSQVGTTAWDGGSRIQSVVEVDDRVIAFASGLEFDSTFEIVDGSFGEVDQRPGDSMYNAVPVLDGVLVVTARSQSAANRISVEVSSDLENWEENNVGGSDSVISTVCSGLGRAWVTTANDLDQPEAWSSLDGLTWSTSIPFVPNDRRTIGRLTACDGDSNRVVIATEFEPRLITSSDGLAWEGLTSPVEVTELDEIVEVAVWGEGVAILVEASHEYAQPKARAYIWDGASWHELDPEPGSLYSSVAFHEGRLHLAGVSTSGQTIWSVELD